MRSLIAAVAGVLFVAGIVHSQDGPTEAVVAAVKRATVFVQVEGTDWKGSGSGFVVKVNKDTVYVATNYHVITGPHAEHKARPAEAGRLARAAKVKLIFDSGTKTERTVNAEPVAVDPEADLAVLRAAALVDPPAPIDSGMSPKLVELMPVYSFGFPFGKALGVGQASPAVTVGKATISSLRLGENGDLTTVQIDGNLNPGNSGGPIVDVKGQLVGVAVATVRDGQGIGFAVPAAELNRVMAGGLGRPYLTVVPAQDGKVTVKADVAVIDPDGAIRGVTLHYAIVNAKEKKPARTDLLEKFAGAKRVALKVESGVAAGEFTLEKPAGELFVQAVPDARDGKGLTLIRSLDLTGAALIAAGKPPAGWKEFIPRDNAFAVWIPERAMRQSEQERTIVIRGVRMRSTSLRVEMPGGLVYTADQLIVPAALTNKLKREELEDGFRDWMASDLNGKVVDESDVQLGAISGREYKIDGERRAGRVRLFVAGAGKVVVLQVTGAADAINGDGTATFLCSCRLSPAVVRKDVPPRPPPVNPLAPAPKRPPEVPAPLMVGFPHGPVFSELAPEHGMLVGLELGLNPEWGRDVVRSVRPIYRVGDKDVLGDKRGTASGQVVKIVARPGYAVGALTAKVGLEIQGLSLTFMKVKDGKLDPKEASESDWVGSNPHMPASKVDAGGEPAIGLTGRADAKNLIAIGPVFRGQEKALGPIAPPGTGPTQILGGAFDPEFLDTGPEGSLLVGLEIGLGKFFDNDVVRAVRPVYRKGSKDELGTQRGSELNRVVKAIAKPGYAVGAVTIKAGLTVDGMSITFMKIKDGKLDPTDAYESEWIGGMGGGGPVKLGGDGNPVVGIVGKANQKDATGLGLLLRK